MAHHHKPMFICLVETRANTDKVHQFCSRFTRGWEWVAITADGRSGGIIILWKKNLDIVTPIAKSKQVLHLALSTPSLNTLIVLVTYDSQQVNIQKKVWRELTRLASLEVPWCILGDFNSIVSSEEHIKGCFNYYNHKAHAFSNFISFNALLDIGFIGSAFSWCNGQSGHAKRWARLDQCLVNTCYTSLFNSYNLLHLPRTFFYHSPLLLNASINLISHHNVFLFENHCLDYVDCYVTVRKALYFQAHSTPMHAFIHILSRVWKNLVDWKSKGN